MKNSIMTDGITKRSNIFVCFMLLLLLSACIPEKSDHEKGLEEMDMGNLDIAIELFSKSIEEGNDLISAYNHRGLSYLYLGEFDMAISDFTSALELEEDAIVYYNRALTWKELDSIGNACSDLEMSGKLNKRDTGLFISTGDAMMELGYFNEAAEMFTNALMLDPLNVEAYNGRGNARMETGDEKGAENDWNRANEILKEI